MKRPKLTFLALALAVAPFAGRGQTNPDPNNTTPPVSGGAPAMDYSQRLSGQAGEVKKLVTAGVSQDIIKTYIDNAPVPFNLTPDNIIQFQQAGLPATLTAEMLNHDGALRQNGMGATQPTPPMMVPPGGQAAPPAGYEMTQPAYDPGAPALPEDYYDSDLAQYGAWQYGPDTGWYWSPYDWAWGYPYPWGLGVFGSGRWWNSPGHGWIWRPGAGFHGRWTGWVGGRYYGGYHGYRGYAGGYHGSVGVHSFGAARGGFGGAGRGFAAAPHAVAHGGGGGFHGGGGGFHGGGGGGGFHGGSGGGGGHGGGHH